MARRQKNDSDLLMEDELTAAFLDEATPMGIADEPSQSTPVAQTSDDEDWDDEQMQDMPGMLAVDVYETKERLYVKARTAGVNKDDLDRRASLAVVRGCPEQTLLDRQVEIGVLQDDGRVLGFEAKNAPQTVGPRVLVLEARGDLC